MKENLMINDENFSDIYEVNSTPEIETTETFLLRRIDDLENRLHQFSENADKRIQELESKTSRM